LKSIQSVIDQDHPVADIIVVDNGSTDGIPDQIRDAFPQVNLIALGENRGLSLARNIGLRHSTGDMVLIIDDDVYISRDALQKMMKAHQDTNAAVVCPRIILYPETDILQCDGAQIHFSGTLSLRHAYQEVSRHVPAREMTGGFIGACLLVERKIFLELGSFDEDYFFYFEDLELSYRLRALGYEICCEERAIVFHQRGRGTENLSFRGTGPYPSRRAYLNLRNRWQTICIHYQARTLLMLLPALALYETAAFAESMRRGWFSEYFRAVFSLAFEIKLLKKRRRWQAMRMVQDADILKGGNLPFSQGFAFGKFAALINLLDSVLNWYWKAAKKWM